MQLAHQAEEMLFGPVPDLGAKTRLIMRPRVSVRDVLAAVSPEALARLRDAVFDLTEYSEDEPEEERLVRALIEPELPDGSADEWFHLYSELGLNDLFPLVVRLRVVNAVDYVVVHELWGMGRLFYEVDGLGDFTEISYDLWSELSPTVRRAPVAAAHRPARVQTSAVPMSSAPAVCAGRRTVCAKSPRTAWSAKRSRRCRASSATVRASCIQSARRPWLHPSPAPQH